MNAITQHPPGGVAGAQGPYWPDWRTVCTSVIGRGHLQFYRECQDAFRCNVAELVHPRTLSNGRPSQPMIVTVSDGLGSAANSAAGSALATTIAQAATERAFAVVDWAAAQAWQLTSTLQGALESAVTQLRAAVAAVTATTQHEWQNSSFNATLLIVVFRPPWLLTANVGDGFVVAQRDDGQLLMVARPNVSGSDASATVSALQGTALARATVSCLYDTALRGFAASTDGLKDISLDWQGRVAETPHHDFFAPLLTRIADGTLAGQQVTQFLHEDRIGAIADDDLTLVAVARATSKDRR